MEFSEKLIRLRKTQHMTQDELAKAVGVSRQAVYKWECGESYPEALKLVALRRLFGVSIDNLLDPYYEVPMPVSTRRRRADAQGAETGERAEAATPDVALTETSAPADETKPAAEKPEKPVEKEETPVEKPTKKNDKPSPAPEEPTDNTAEKPAQNTEKEKRSLFSRLFGRK